jgi:hypothetical protein
MGVVMERWCPTQPVLGVFLMIEQFANEVDAALKGQSGKVFYSGRAAFAHPTDLYMLGVNPGGCPIAQATDTVSSSIAHVLNDLPDHWSAYRDESWKNKRPGTHGMQPRVLHMVRCLGRDPHEIPASNLIFLRTRAEADLRETGQLANLCWPFHKAVIAALQPKVILCFGRTVGEFVEARLKANSYVGQFTEANDRGWQSTAYRTESGQIVVTVTHPSRADWTNPVADPTPLVKAMLR